MIQMPGGGSVTLTPDYHQSYLYRCHFPVKKVLIFSEGKIKTIVSSCISTWLYCTRSDYFTLLCDKYGRRVGAQSKVGEDEGEKSMYPEERENKKGH